MELNRSHSFHHSTVKREDIPALHHADEKSSERKLEEIRNGGILKEGNPMLPDSRQNKDVLWVPVFVAAFLAVVASALMNAHIFAGHHSDVLEVELTGGTLGAVVAVVVAIACLHIAHRHPEAVVYVSLYFSPTMFCLAGCAVMAMAIGHGDPQAFQLGGVLAGVGLLCILCVGCCYTKLIPFMIEIVRMVSEIILTNPAMLIVAFALAVSNLIWVVLCCVGMGGALISHPDSRGRLDGRLLMACIFVFFWGAQIIYNVCHVTYCGVFARSYYQRPMSEGPVRKSLGAALTTSFGSICFGSFVVACVQTLEMIAQAVREKAQKEGNAVTCILACIIECFIRCIGDILQYFNDWAYVQCAVRGVGFMDGVRITFAMLTCGNVQYIIRDLLLNSVISTGALLCAAVGGVCAFGFGLASSDPLVASNCAVYGLVGGLMAGGTAFGVIGSGVKTILVCWVDNPSPLKLSHEAMDEQFARRVNQGYDQHMGIMRG